MMGVDARIPRWLLITGALFVPGTVALMLRIVWEETFLTAERGPQMVGFALMHGALGGIVVPMLLSTLGLHMWAVVMVIVVVCQKLRGGSAPRVARGLMGVVIAAALPLYVPYGWWRYLVLRFGGPGEHIGEHLTYAAALDEPYNIRELLRRGVAVDTPDSSGNTALGGACVAGNLAMVKFLVQQGATVNRRLGFLERTSLMNAVEMGHPNVVEYLLTAGADVSLTDKDGKTALAIAREKGDTKTISLLQRMEGK